MSDAFRDRAARRRGWPIRVYPLASQPGDDLSDVTTPEQRIEMVRVLSARMWDLTARPRPTYTRATMPVWVGPRQ